MIIRMGDMNEFFSAFLERRTIAAVALAGIGLTGCSVSIPQDEANLDSLSFQSVPSEQAIGPQRLRPPEAPPEISFGPAVVSAATVLPLLKPLKPKSERACLSSGQVQISEYVRQASLPSSSFGGLSDMASGCSAIEPFKVSAADEGRVQLEPAATLQCPMIPALEVWLRNVVKPAAERHFGSEVVGVKVAASYSCRRINSKFYNKMSQHAYANAIDISEFTLADSRTVTVKDGWLGDEPERAFLREVHRGGCKVFTTVLGPNADRYHHDHFHLDLARHNASGTYRICK